MLSAAPQVVAPADCVPATYECAVSRVEQHDFDSGIRALEAVLAESPRHLRALNLLGIALTGAGRVDQANVRFRAALTIDPAFYPARKNLAINEFRSGRLAQAERHFEQVLALAPDDGVVHVHLGEIAYGRKRLSAALPHYIKGGDRVWSDPSWTLHYGICLLEAGKAADAVAAFERLPPEAAARRFEAGAALGRARAYKDAARLFGSARGRLEDPYAAGYNEVLMLIEGGDHERAIRVADEMFVQGMRKAELYNLVSRAYLGAGRVQQAYDALRAAITLEPAVEQHYVDLALICMDHENFDLGLEIVDIAIGRRPDAAMLHLYRGVLLVMKGLVEQAEGEFSRARQLQPSNPAAAVALAMAWMQAGQPDRAVALLREENRGKPKQAIVPYMLGIALLRSGADPEAAGGAEAMLAFESAIRLDPALGGARNELGKLLLKRGEVERAILQLEKAVSLDPTSAAPAYSLAQAYGRVGRTDEARTLLATVSRLNAQERGDDVDRELKRVVVRLVREESAAAPAVPRP